MKRQKTREETLEDIQGKGAIIGGKGTGKTHIIVNDAIPIFKEHDIPYVVFDFINDPHYPVDENYVVIERKNNNFKEPTEKAIRELDDDIFIIIDNATLLGYQHFVKSESNPIGQSDMNWLLDAIGDRNAVLVFEQVSTLYNQSIVDRFDEFLIIESPFGNTDAENRLKQQFGNKVRTKERYNQRI